MSKIFDHPPEHNTPITFQDKWKVKNSEWLCELTPGVFFHPLEGMEPNWFHRIMQRIAFGFAWKKTK